MKGDQINNNGGTSAWGPPLWASIHFIALGYDRSHPEAYVSFYRSLIGTIPCKKCSSHYEQELKNDPVEDNLHDIFAWTVRLHNSVNKRLGKETWSVERARKYYSDKVFGSPTKSKMGIHAEEDKTGTEYDSDQRQLFEQSNTTQEESDESMRVQRARKRRRSVILVIIALAITAVLLLTAAAYFKGGTCGSSSLS